MLYVQKEIEKKTIQIKRDLQNRTLLIEETNLSVMMHDKLVKKNLYISKETYKKRPIVIKRDLNTSKKAYNQKQPMVENICVTLAAWHKSLK